MLRFASREQREQAMDRLLKESKEIEKILDKYSIVNVLEDSSSPEPKVNSIAGMKRNKILTRRRSPHVNKKHRDQF
jgi:hypothetical protein